jgi:chromosome segregation ATPase
MTKIQKRDVEFTLKKLKGDLEKCNALLKTTTRSKENLESVQKVEKARFEKELKTKEDRIVEMQTIRESDARMVKKLQEQKEQLMFQVTDLQNSLDREASTVNAVNFELIQLRKSTEENTFQLEDQVEKLHTARVNLTNDKRQILDKLKTTRADLVKSDEKHEALSVVHDESKTSAGNLERVLKTQLTHLLQEHKKLQGDFATSTQRCKVLKDQNAKVKAQNETYLKKYTETETKYSELTDTHTVVTLECARLKELGGKLTQDGLDTKIHLNSVLTKIGELNSTIVRQEGEYNALSVQSNNEITLLNKAVYTSTEEAKRLHNLKAKLDVIITKLDTELESTSVKLQAERSRAEKLLQSLDDLRHSLVSEKRNRIGLERVQRKIDRNKFENGVNVGFQRRERDRILEAIEMGMRGESLRLNNVAEILPLPEDLLSVAAPTVKEFPRVGSGGRHSPVPKVSIYNVKCESQR